MATLAGAWAAQACSLVTPTPRPGQTLEQAFREMYDAADRVLWRAAPVIYRARVVEVAPGPHGPRYVFAPVQAIKGGRPPARLAWSPFGAGCQFYEGRAGDTVTVFARRTAWREGPLRWGAWQVLDAWPQR